MFLDAEVYGLEGVEMCECVRDEVCGHERIGGPSGRVYSKVSGCVMVRVYMERDRIRDGCRDRAERGHGTGRASRTWHTLRTR